MIAYRERNRIAQELAYDAFVDTDKKLLRRYAPKSSLLVRTLKSSNGATLSYDIVYTLLQYCTREDILRNREAVRQETQSAPEMGKQPAMTNAPGSKDAAKPEKKRPPKKKSTPKSTGKTSKTQMSSGPNSSTRTE